MTAELRRVPGGAARAVGPPAARPVELPAATGFRPALAAVYTAQLARARVARVSLLFVATLQSVGILLLLRGVVDSSELTRQSIVAGSTVLVAAFVALNLLAQRLGALRASGGLDHYAALPVPASAVVLGIAASYASFTVPGAVLTAVLGAVLYGLPLAHLWILVPVLPLAGAALAGMGAVVGLLAPRAELATVAGQLGMSVVLFLGIVPPGRLPVLLRGLRAVVPSTYAVDALAASFDASPDWAGITLRLGGCAAVALAFLALAGWAFRRAVVR